MMKNSSKKIIVLLILLAAVFLIIRLSSTRQKSANGGIEIVHPAMGNVLLTVTTTGVVEPQNRLEIKPSISGRIEDILVEEGDRVKVGDTLAWMSSTERAALVDVARGQGNETLQYWEEVYKKTPIVSPIDGEVIVRSVEPGQTVTTQDPILVLSNRLVINAQFDETDIGRVRVGQKAIITLDAYPDIKIDGVVDHIAYESKIVNNVTIYEVDIVPKEIPEILRSGMSVNVEVIEKERYDVMTIPSSAIHYNRERQFVLIANPKGGIAERDIKAGLNNEKIAEILSGLTLKERVVTKNIEYLPKKKNSGTNPFTPSRR